MAADLSFYMQVASNAGDTFSSSVQGDVLIFPDSNTQRFLIGKTQTSNPMILITSNLSQINGNMTINDSVVLRGLEVSMGNGLMANITSHAVYGYSNTSNGIQFNIDSNIANFKYSWVAGVSATEVMKLGGDGNLTMYGGDVTLYNSSSSVLRLRGSNYGAMWLNSAGVTSLLLTSNNDPDGTSNGLRPMTINNSNGYIGINTTNLRYPLSVYGFSTGSTTYRYLTNNSTGFVTAGGAGGGWSIYCDKSISCEEINCYSDRRIKCDIQNLNTSEIVEKLVKLTPCSFNYIDTVVKGDQQNIGFIAQEVEEVFPNTVKNNSECIPNIFQFGKITKTTQDTYDVCLSSLNIDVKLDDLIKIAADTHIECKVVGIVIADNTTTLTVHSPYPIPTREDVFVIGKRAIDCRVMNYENIIALSVAAIQDLTKSVKRLQEMLAQAQAKAKHNISDL